jgi:cytochrome c5
VAYQKPKDPMALPVIVISSVALLLTVYVLVSSLFNTISKNSTKGAEDTSLQTAMADANIQPIGNVHTVDKSVAPKARSGEEVYNAVCTGCHATGAMDAPKLEKAAWDSRLGNGLKGLMDNAINGKGQMPARGGDPSLTDEELQNAILYMADKAGLDLGDEAQAASTSGGDAAPAESAPAQEQASSGGAPTAPVAPQQAESPTAPEAPSPAQAPAPAPASNEAPAADAAPAAGGASVVATAEGEKVYKGLCFSCHDNGVAGAPKVGDADAWSARIATGMDAMYETSLNGKGAMPAKGGNPALSDAEIKAAVDYMIANSQAADAAPAPEAAPAEEKAEAAPAPAAADAEVVATAEGEKVYKGLCFSCHDNGVAGAPKVGDADAWAARIATGMDAMYETSLNGKGAMPAKGGNPALSDDEIKAAVDYMVANSK